MKYIFKKLCELKSPTYKFIYNEKDGEISKIGIAILEKYFKGHEARGAHYN